MNPLPPTSRTESKLNHIGAPAPKQPPLSRVCGFSACNQIIPHGKAKLCTRCRAVFYCRPECQRGAWKVHQAVCKPKQEIIPVKPAGPTHDKVGELVPKDVVSYSSLSSSEEIERLKEEGYRGLKSFDERFISDHDYVEILKCLWTEDDLGLKIEWLRGYANQGYPILMFELSRFLAEKAKENGFLSETVKESVKWWFFGIHGTGLDALCFKDKTIQLGLVSLMENYMYIKAFDEKVLSRVFGKGHRAADDWGFKEQQRYEPKNMKSTPHWIGYFGEEYALTRKLDILEPKDWENTRMKTHYAILGIIS